jgi:hypothetical protein
MTKAIAAMIAMTLDNGHPSRHSLGVLFAILYSMFRIAQVGSEGFDGSIRSRVNLGPNLGRSSPEEQLMRTKHQARLRS